MADDAPQEPPKKKAAPKKTTSKRVKSDASKKLEHGGSDGFSDRRDALQSKLVAGLMQKNKELELLTPEQAIWRNGGIAMPSLCWRYLCCQDAMPLGRSITLAGPFGSNKTTLAVQLLSWLLWYSGLNYYWDVEGKFNIDVAYSQIPQELLKYFSLIKPRNQQNWQSGVTTVFEKMRQNDKDFTTPIGTGIDSLAALKPQEEMDKAWKERQGAGARSHPAVALLNADWMQMIAPMLATGPFLCVMIQHSREVQVEGTYTTKTEYKGGRAAGYNKSLAFDLSAAKMPEGSYGRGGSWITIKCTKNAMGTTGRYIKVPLRWRKEHVLGAEVDPETGLLPTKTVFHWGWHEASMMLLSDMENSDGQKAMFKEISGATGLKFQPGRRVSSNKMGVGADNPVTYAQMGEILEYEHPELLPVIYQVLGIERRPIIQPGQSLKDCWAGKIAIPSIPALVPYPRSTANDIGEAA